MSLEFDHWSNKVNTIWGVHQVADSLAAPMTLNESRHWQLFHFHFLSKPQGSQTHHLPCDTCTDEGQESNFWTKGDKNKQSIITWPLGAPLLCKINPTGINTTLWKKHMQASWAARDYNNISLSFLSCAILVCQLRSPIKEQYYVTVDERDSLL